MKRKGLICKKMLSIYTLTCPIENKVKYVGKSESIIQRYKSHLQSPTPSTKEWVELMKSKNLLPIMTEIERVEYRNATTREIFWIKKFEKEVGGLLNIRHNNEVKKLPIIFLKKKLIAA